MCQGASGVKYSRLCVREHQGLSTLGCVSGISGVKHSRLCIREYQKLSTLGCVSGSIRG